MPIFIRHFLIYELPAVPLVQKIDSLELPELAPYRTLRRPLEHREQGIFVAEGEKVVRRLLESDFTVVSLLLPEKWFLEYEPLIGSRPENISVYLAEKSILEKLVGFSMFQGVLAVAQIPGTTKRHRLEENVGAADVELTANDLAEIENAASQLTIQGARYPEAMERMSNR